MKTCMHSVNQKKRLGRDLALMNPGLSSWACDTKDRRFTYSIGREVTIFELTTRLFGKDGRLY